MLGPLDHTPLGSGDRLKHFLGIRSNGTEGTQLPGGVDATQQTSEGQLSFSTSGQTDSLQATAIKMLTENQNAGVALANDIMRAGQDASGQLKQVLSTVLLKQQIFFSGLKQGVFCNQWFARPRKCSCFTDDHSGAIIFESVWGNEQSRP